MILDVDLHRGFFYLVLKNIGDDAAVGVVTKIGGKIIGPDGKKEINTINLFRNLEFFPPGKEFRVLVGSATLYFSSNQPTKFTAAISYSDHEKNKYEETIGHNLEIYRDLPQEFEG